MAGRASQQIQFRHCAVKIGPKSHIHISWDTQISYLLFITILFINLLQRVSSLCFNVPSTQTRPETEERSHDREDIAQRMFVFFAGECSLLTEIVFQRDAILAMSPDSKEKHLRNWTRNWNLNSSKKKTDAL